eukprot:gene18828-biopygen11491
MSGQSFITRACVPSKAQSHLTTSHHIGDEWGSSICTHRPFLEDPVAARSTMMKVEVRIEDVRAAKAAFPRAAPNTRTRDFWAGLGLVWCEGHLK